MGDGTTTVAPEGRGKDRNSPIVIRDVGIRHSTVGTKLERSAAQPGTPITLGSALKRNPDESFAIPVMVKRPPKTPKITRSVFSVQFQAQEPTDPRSQKALRSWKPPST
jgi:hypothetical protein